MRALVGHPSLLRGVVLRVVVLWSAVRIFALLVGGGIDAVGAAFLALVISVVIVIDAMATRELLFLRNLGLSWPWLVAVTLLTTLALESLLALVLAL